LKKIFSLKEVNTNRLLLKNTAVLTAGKVSGDLFTFLFLVYFARMFGTDILGKYAFAMSIGGFLAIFISMGLNIVMVRDLSQDSSLSAKYMVNLLFTQSIVALPVWLLIGIFALTQPIGHDTKIIIVIIGTYHVFYKLTMVVRSQFRAREELQYSAFLEIFHKIIILIFGIAAITIWKNPVITLAAYPISAFSMFLVGLWISFSRYGIPASKVNIIFIKNLFKTALPFFAILILLEFYIRIGLILLTYFQGEAAAGIYAASDRLLVTIATGANMLAYVILPTMSRLSVHDRDEFFKLFERTIRLILITGLPICTLLFISSRPIIMIIFGDQYAESIAVLSILSWSLFFFAMNLLIRVFLIANHQQNQWVKIASIIYLCYGLSCTILIPLYNYIGLAYARLLAEIFLFTITYIYIHKTTYKIPLIKMGSAPVVSCLMSIIVFYLLAGASLLLKIPCALIVCIAAMSLLKGIQLHDFQFAKELLFRKKGLKQEELFYE
jgi:O-antigen/teichoic acid export membrane protein